MRKNRFPYRFLMLRQFMRRYLSAALLLATFASVAWPAYAQRSTQTAKTKIEFWTMQLSPFHDAYVNGVIASFERENPTIQVKWVDIPWSEMERKTLTSLAAKSAPDVVNLNPQFSSKLAEFGALANPEKYLSEAEIATFLPAAWRSNQLDGKTFALPWYLNTNVILYNKEILARAEVNVPATYDELLTISRVIKKRTGSYAYFPSLDGSNPLEAMVSMGGKLISDDGCKPGFINARGEAVLRFYQRLYQDELVPKNVVTEGHRKAVEMFLSGQIAMVTTGMQFLEFIKTSNPDFYKKIGVAPQLVFADEHKKSPPNIAAMNIAVLDASPNKIAAFAFAKFVTNNDSQMALARRVPILPSTRESYDLPFFKTARDDAILNRAQTLSVEQVMVGQVLVPPMRSYSKFKSNYARNLQSVMLNKKTIPDAMRDMDSTWSAILGCKKMKPKT